jgi:hypothetical protein
MMRGNPLVIEVLAGLGRRGAAEHHAFGLLVLLVAVLIVWWPKTGLEQVLESQQAPNTLTAVVIALGIAMSYLALLCGAEEIMLRGQHGLRDWALATPLRPGRILRGYVLGHTLYSVRCLALSLPVLLTAFTISGGEWAALGWCVAAALIQAVFYRLCGAITHLMIGQHRAESRFAVRAILVLVYVPVGLAAPVTSHVAFTSRVLGEDMGSGMALAAAPDNVAFLAAYAVLGMIAALALYWLLSRERRGMAAPPGGDEGSPHGSGAGNK